MTSSRFATIAVDLRERIALGEFGQLGALDSEADLGRHYGVSRPTVRKALERLRDQGLVSARHGAGWFVTGRAFHQPLAIGAFRHAGSAVTESGRAAVRRIVAFGYVEAASSLAATLGVAEGDLLYARSVRSVDGVALDIASEWVPPALAGAISRDDATDPGIWATLARRGVRISSVRQTITAGAASDPDAVLLGVEPASPLLLVRRLALDADGLPVALADHRYVAHRFVLEVEFTNDPGSAGQEPPGLRALDDPGTPVPTGHPEARPATIHLREVHP